MGLWFVGIAMTVGMQVDEVQVLSKGLQTAVTGIDVFIGI
jgi:hypothetical protein